MYSKAKGLTDRGPGLTPPPGYDGSRFKRRSDGRDDAFPLYRERPRYTARKAPSPPEPEDRPKDNAPAAHTKEKDSAALSFLKNLGEEELLLITLIILLSAEGAHTESRTVLILALLLCVG